MYYLFEMSDKEQYTTDYNVCQKNFIRISRIFHSDISNNTIDVFLIQQNLFTFIGRIHYTLSPSTSSAIFTA